MMKNQPKGDLWNIKETNKTSQFYGGIYRFDFSYIASDEIKDIVKDYVWQNYRNGNNALRTLNLKVGSLKDFNAFLINRKITSLKKLTPSDSDNFLSYLRTVVSNKTGKPLHYKTQKKKFDAFKAIVNWCQLHRPEDVPKTKIFTGNEYRNTNKKLKIDFIPDEIVEQINEALKTEENAYLKYSIIILQSTGMRIGELIKLRTDCIQKHLISGYTIQWLNQKKKEYRNPMPVRIECVQAVNALIELTKDLRLECDEIDKNTLMIHRVSGGVKDGKVKVPHRDTFRYWLKNYIKRNNIMDANGEFYNLTSHQFRRTLGTDMLSQGININVIQEVLGHADPAITKRYYADVKDKERGEMFKNIGIIGNVNLINSSAFDSITDFEWFKENKDKRACMADGYCTKPFENGEICDRLLKSQKCYTCSRYITTPEYMETHKQHLANLERQLEENAIYGDHYAEHFIPTIEVLKIIIGRLEDLQNDRH